MSKMTTERQFNQTTDDKGEMVMSKKNGSSHSGRHAMTEPDMPPPPVFESADSFLERLDRELPLEDEDDGVPAMQAASHVAEPPPVDFIIGNDKPDEPMEEVEAEGEEDLTGEYKPPIDEPAVDVTAFRAEVMENPDKVWSVPPDKIIVDPTRNGRTAPRKESDADVKELAKAIAQDGQMQPGEVLLDIDGHMYLTFGFGRIAAINSLNATRKTSDKLLFQCYVRTGFDTVTGRVRNANENWKRKELTVLDKAQIVNDLMGEPFKLNQIQIAQRLGISKASCSNYVKVSAFPQTVKDLMGANGNPEVLGRKAAMDLCVLPADKIEEAAKELVSASGGKTITARDVKKTKAKKNVAPAATKKLDMIEFLSVLDFIFEKSNVKLLHKSTEEILRIVADIAWGRVKQDSGLKKLAAFQ